MLVSCSSSGGIITFSRQYNTSSTSQKGPQVLSIPMYIRDSHLYVYDDALETCRFRQKKTKSLARSVCQLVHKNLSKESKHSIREQEIYTSEM